MEKTRFNDLMQGIAGIFNTTLTEFLLEMYYNIFKGYDFEQFKKAMTNVVMNHKYNTFPKPAEILEYLEGTRDDKALSAWIQAKKAVQVVGYYHTPAFADPVISHCLEELGGWMKFCSEKIEDLPFIEKRFLTLYRLFLKREITEPIKLCGFIEVSNSEKGFIKDIPEPIKIGYEKEENKALEYEPQP